MNMKVLFTCPCDFTEVQADVEALRMKNRLQEADGALEKLEKFLKFLRSQLFQTETVAFRRHHQMTVVVRKFVHHHKGVPSPKEDEMFFILSLPGIDTEETTFFLVGKDIRHSPWSPEPLHR